MAFWKCLTKPTTLRCHLLHDAGHAFTAAVCILAAKLMGMGWHTAAWVGTAAPVIVVEGIKDLLNIEWRLAWPPLVFHGVQRLQPSKDSIHDVVTYLPPIGVYFMFTGGVGVLAGIVLLLSVACMVGVYYYERLWPK